MCDVCDIAIAFPARCTMYNDYLVGEFQNKLKKNEDTKKKDFLCRENDVVHKNHEGTMQRVCYKYAMKR